MTEGGIGESSKLRDLCWEMSREMGRIPGRIRALRCLKVFGGRLLGIEVPVRVREVGGSNPLAPTEGSQGLMTTIELTPDGRAADCLMPFHSRLFLCPSASMHGVRHGSLEELKRNTRLHAPMRGIGRT